MMRDIADRTDGELEITSGDILFIDGTEQHKRDILISAPGDYHEAPLTGVDSLSYINDGDESYLRDASRQLQRDGLRVNQVAFDRDGNLIIDGSYD